MPTAILLQRRTGQVLPRASRYQSILKSGVFWRIWGIDMAPIMAAHPLAKAQAIAATVSWTPETRTISHIRETLNTMTTLNRYLRAPLPIITRYRSAAAATRLIIILLWP